jgi:hypothetical protein
MLTIRPGAVGKSARNSGSWIDDGEKEGGAFSEKFQHYFDLLMGQSLHFIRLFIRGSTLDLALN